MAQINSPVEIIMSKENFKYVFPLKAAPVLRKKKLYSLSNCQSRVIFLQPTLDIFPHP